MVPILDSKKPFSENGFQGDRNLILQKDETGRFKVKIIEIYKNGPLPESKVRWQIFNEAYNELKGKSSKKADSFTGWACLYDENYKYINGKVYNNGLAIPGKVRPYIKDHFDNALKNNRNLNSPRVQSTTARSATCENQSGGWWQTCTEWYMAPENGGEFLYETCGDPYYVPNSNGALATDPLIVYNNGWWAGGGGGNTVVPSDVTKIPFWDRLTPAEKNILGNNALNVLIYYANSLSASFRTQQFYGSDGDNDKGNAFKHALFMIWNCHDFGPTVGSLLGIAHEQGKSGLSTDMDFWNNGKGYLIYQNEDTSTWQATLDAVQQAVSNGTLKYIKNGELVPTNQ
jgi:hypothetical protein